MKNRMVRTSLFTLCGLLFCSSAFAQQKKRPPPVTESKEAPPPEVVAPTIKPLSEALTGQAATDNSAGKVLFGDGDPAGAKVKFQSAFDKSGDPRLLFSIAACEKSQRHYSKVIPLLQRYLDEAGKQNLLTDQDKTQATDLIKLILPLTAKVLITSNIEGADVFVDDENVGKTPLTAPVVVDIGTRRFRIVKDDFKEYAQTLPVEGEHDLAVTATLKQIVHEGKLIIHAGVKDAISLDGKVVGSGTYSTTLPSGGHQLKVSSEGMRSYQSDVMIKDDDERNLTIVLEKEPSKGLPAAVWIVGGVVLATGAAVGGYFLFKPKDEYVLGPKGTGPFGTDGQISLSHF